MRRQEFPFAKYRDWGKAPEKSPVIDFGLVAELGDWQKEIYKKPILDDITGYYQFFPSQNGAASYVTRAARRTETKPVENEDPLEFNERRKRQVLHIAETAELATSLFWATAVMRQKTLNVAGSHDEHADDESVKHYTADAIADYGYCLVHPVDIGVDGDKGPGLKAQIERIAPGLGQALLDFGNFAVDNPAVLDTPYGAMAITLTAEEQARRVNHWAPRHVAVLNAFPDLKPDNAIVNLDMDFPELFKQHHELR